MATDTDRVWLITGCSSGFGRALAQEVLSRGYPLMATARRPEELEDLTSERTLIQPLDVTSTDQVQTAVDAAMQKWGRIDVLVNNAGYGAAGAIEEVTEDAIRRLYDVNVFGVLRMTRAVLPILRNQRSGHILMLSSVVGFCGFPGVGIYASSKHAVEGFSEALAGELEPLGVRVTIVEPGPFRTDFFGRSLELPQTPIADYTETSGARLEKLRSMDGAAPGDPVRAARLMVDLTEQDNPPLRMPLGKLAVDGIREKLTGVLASVEQTEQISLSADFPE